MTYQSRPATFRLSWAKGQFYLLLLLQGTGCLFPLSLFNGGATLAQSSSNSKVQSLPALKQDSSSSSSAQASQEKKPPEVPNYESVPPMRVNESETQNQASSEAQSKPLSHSKQASSKPQSQSSPAQNQSASGQQSQSAEKSQLEPVQPLVDSTSPETGKSSPKPKQQPPSPNTAPTVELEQRNPKQQKPTDTATTEETESASRETGKAPPKPKQQSPTPNTAPTVELEQRKPKQQPADTTTAKSKQEPANLPKIDNSQPPEKPSNRKTTNQDFVDPNGYPRNGKDSLPTPQVEASDRDSNCTTVIENGKLVSGSCNVSQQETKEETNSQQARVEPEKLPSLPKNFEQPNKQPDPSQQTDTSQQTEPSQHKEVRRTYTPPKDLPQLKLPGNGDSQLLFPLARASRISADYGWRSHPVHGESRFHTGTDFAAPEGTPVVATKSGRVSLADYHSGYGLMVGLRHNGKNESRYAHLSQIHVKPGQWVEQGTVIGRVGSTGLSTGPHLHFEWRIRKGSRWVAVNAQEQLLASRANLASSQTAFRRMGDANQETTGGNFLAYLPEIVASLPKQPASWMSVPQLDFLKNSDFGQAYQRKASLKRFSGGSNSVLVSPFSLPNVLASVFNWEHPQLFAEQNWQRVPTKSQTSSGEEFVYRPPSAHEMQKANQYRQIAQFFDPRETLESATNTPKTLESVTNMQALGGLNFSSPHQRNPKKLSDYSLKDNHVRPKRRQ